MRENRCKLVLPLFCDTVIVVPNGEEQLCSSDPSLQSAIPSQICSIEILDGVLDDALEHKNSVRELPAKKIAETRFRAYTVQMITQLQNTDTSFPWLHKVLSLLIGQRDKSSSSPMQLKLSSKVGCRSCPRTFVYPSASIMYIIYECFRQKSEIIFHLHWGIPTDGRQQMLLGSSMS